MTTAPLLRIHATSLSWRHAEECVVECVGVLDEIAELRLEGPLRTVHAGVIIGDLEPAFGYLQKTRIR